MFGLEFNKNEPQQLETRQIQRHALDTMGNMPCFPLALVEVAESLGVYHLNDAIQDEYHSETVLDDIQRLINGTGMQISCVQIADSNEGHSINIPGALIHSVEPLVNESVPMPAIQLMVHKGVVTNGDPIGHAVALTKPYDLGFSEQRRDQGWEVFAAIQFEADKSK